MKIATVGHFERSISLMETMIELCANESPFENIELCCQIDLEGEGTAPNRMQVLPAPNSDGVIKGADGRIYKFNPQELVVALNGQRQDTVIDYEHGSELLAPKGKKSPAAGWIKGWTEEQGAIFAELNYWTPDGKTDVEAKNYRFNSPALNLRKGTREIIGIKSVGLTNQQNLDTPALNREGMEEIDMEFLKKLAKWLGLAEDATEDAVMAALEAMKAKSEETPEQGAPDLNHFVPRADHELALNRANTAETELAGIKKQTLDVEINSVIGLAMKDGKIAPTSKEFYVELCQQEGGVDKFKEFIKTAPKVIENTELAGKKFDGDEAELNQAQSEMAALFGNTSEDLKKYSDE